MSKGRWVDEFVGSKLRNIANYAAVDCYSDGGSMIDALSSVGPGSMAGTWAQVREMCPRGRAAQAKI
jgi:hypothetical protein